MRWPLLAVIMLSVLNGGCTDRSAVNQDATRSSPVSGTPDAKKAGAPADALRQLLEGAETPLIATMPRDRLKPFYASRGFAPLWINASGLNGNGQALVLRLTRIAAAGRPELLLVIAAATSEAIGNKSGDGAEVELLLSWSVASLAIDRTRAEHFSTPADVLEKLSVVRDFPKWLDDAMPDDAAIWRLMAAKDVYRQIAQAGGWPLVSSGPKLTTGMSDARIAALRQRLLVTGDLPQSEARGEAFDAGLVAAVMRFQSRHGLAADGVVGTGTLDALNHSVEQRLRMMQLNVKRLLQEHREWGDRYVAVNTAAATYRLVENGNQVFERPAIVGRPDWQTPRMDGTIDKLEFHPAWVVPTRIARLELWPKIRRDPSYLAKHDMVVVDGQIRQRPGPRNPLGLVKFIFPNDSSIFLHDTDRHDLFAEASRFRSHGCVRVSEPLDFARYLLKADPNWPEARIAAVVQDSPTVRVPLARPIPVHIIYDTAWVDVAGIIQFRDDVYGRDHQLAGLVEVGAKGEAGCPGN